MFMRKKKLLIIASGVAAVALAVAILVNVLKPPASATTTSGNSSASTITEVKAPEIDSTSPASTPQGTSSSAIVVDVGGDNSQPAEEKTPAKEAAKPVTPSKPAAPTNTSSADKGSGGITIGGNNTVSAVISETTAFLANLMEKGCPYCCSHTCPSFYAKDQWDNPCYDPKLCPQYDIHKDPVYYCQVCGKRVGDGTNSTCVRFVTDTICPNCGEFVKANTCHTCPDK